MQGPAHVEVDAPVRIAMSGRPPRSAATRSLRAIVQDTVLADIIANFLNLLDTKALIYEPGGDCVLSAPPSGVCWLANEACASQDGGREGRQSCGAGSCPESSSQAARTGMETCQLAEVACVHGSFLAVPISVDSDVVGGLCGGYPASYDADLVRKRLSAAAAFLGALVERSEALEELRVQQDRYRLLVEATASAAGSLDPELKCVEPQPSWEAYTGQTWEEHRGLGWQDAIHPDDRELARAAMAQALSEKRRGSGIGRVWHASSGQYRYGSALLVPVPNADGTMREWATIFRDTHEQHVAEDALRKNEELNRAILAALPANIAVVDEAGVIVSVNAAWNGFARENGGVGPIGPGANYLEVCRESAREGDLLAEVALAGIREVLEQKRRRFRLEYPCHSPSVERWFLLTAAPLAGRSGAVLSHIDITVRKQYAERLAKERNLLRTVIDNLPDVVYAKDFSSRFLLANAAIARHMGAATPEELLGKTDFDYYSAELASLFRRDEERVIETGEPIVAQEEPTVDILGNPGWMSTTKVPIRDPYGGIIGLVGIGRDITERRCQEESRKALELELQQAQKLESIGRMASGIAHEINTPVQFISDNNVFLRRAFTRLVDVLESMRLLTEAAKTGTVDPAMVQEVSEAFQKAKIAYLVEQVPRALDQSREGLDRVAQIVVAMKEFSHPSKGHKEPVDLARAIETTLTVARNEWKYVADVVTDFDPQVPPTPCLRDEFNQVVLNMVVNAAHAIAEHPRDGENEKGTITVETRLVRDLAEIRISDTGIGIPPEIRHKIFEPFFTTKEVGKGTGQGLAIARSVIVDKHHGQIDVESEVGKGTTFIIHLPLEDDDGDGGGEA